jgi:uncharacterized protein YndB with AHSA1/START domain
MTSTPSETRIIGSLRLLPDGKGAVRMEDVYATDVDDLWLAVTDPERLARWVATVEGDLRVGGRIYCRFTSSWEGPGRIDVCEAPHHLVVTQSPGESDEAVLEATLTAEGTRTRLVVEERGLPAAVLAGHGAGWQAHVEDLAAHLDGRDRGDWHGRWVALSPSYEEIAGRLG